MIEEIPTDLLNWMRTQSRSAFVGDMLRKIQRDGGVSSRQLEELQLQRLRQRDMDRLFGSN